MNARIREAVANYEPREAGCPEYLALKGWEISDGAHDNPLNCAWCCDAIAAAVLRAADQGESDGAWKYYPVDIGDMGDPETIWYVSDQQMRPDPGAICAGSGDRGRKVARAIVNALNRCAARTERGEHG